MVESVGGVGAKFWHDMDWGKPNERGIVFILQGPCLFVVRLRACLCVWDVRMCGGRVCCCCFGGLCISGEMYTLRYSRMLRI